MGHGGRRGRQKTRTGAKERQPAPLTQQQEELVAELTNQTAGLASALHEARPEGREAMIARLAPVTEVEEPVAFAYAQRLGATRGEFARRADHGCGCNRRACAPPSPCPQKRSPLP
jgi:hypothetical protein